MHSRRCTVCDRLIHPLQWRLHRLTREHRENRRAFAEQHHRL